MRRRTPRVLDASAMVALFAGDKQVTRFVTEAERGAIHLLLPTTAIAEAENHVLAGPGRVAKAHTVHDARRAARHLRRSPEVARTG